MITITMIKTITAATIMIIIIIVAADLGFTTLKVIGVAFYIESKKSDKILFRGSNFDLRFFYMT